MGESVKCGNSVQLSVPFGKFESDALSWEKRSSFSPNKYLEEVGSLSTPGSVAQKKAYFEAHYKKIAAQKAELLEAENAIEIDPSISDNNQDMADQTIKASRISTNEIPLTISNDDPKEDDFTAVICENSLVVTEEEIVLVGDETHRNEPPKPERAEDNLKIDADSRRNEKVITNKKEQNSAETRKNKKHVPTISKSATNSTRKLLKPEPMSTLISPSRPSAEKSSVSSMSRTKNATAVKSTLHMSLNLDPSNYSSGPPSHTTTRKSVFMEKMGDKDIVKRVFKTFQNSFNQSRSSGDEYSTENKQPPGNVPYTGIEQKVSTSTASRKENERMRHNEKKINAQRGRLGTTWNSVSSGSFNEAGLGVGGIKLKVSSSSTGSRSDERTEKQKEFVKKLEAKSYAKETEKSRIRLKLKAEKELETNRVRQSFNFKAKPLPDFYRSLNISSERVVVKSGICGRPQAA